MTEIPTSIVVRLVDLVDEFDLQGWRLTLVAFEEFQETPKDYETFTGKVAGVHYIGRREAK